MSVQIYGASSEAINILPERFERKYYLIPRDVGLAYGLLRNICRVAGEYPSEQINSLYFDTPDLEQYERSYDGDYYKDKVRIRWYSEDSYTSGRHAIFVELKSRQGFSSIKRRFKLKGIIPRTLLMNLLARFGYFPTIMLVPIIKISYWRYRFSEISTSQRISLDCHIRSTIVKPGLGNDERDLKLPGAVMEMKGQTMELPIPLRQAKMLDTDWTRFSKYSACLDSHIEEPGTIGRLSPSGRIVQTLYN